MDARKLGSFIAEQRKALGMTQAELGEKLHVTDKAISRWERGQGLPDINTIELLAVALELSISEVMRAEKGSEDISVQKASDGIKNVIDLVEQKQEKRKIFCVSGIAAVLVFCILLIDNMGILGFFICGTPLLCIDSRGIHDNNGNNQKEKKTFVQIDIFYRGHSYNHSYPYRNLLCYCWIFRTWTGSRLRISI